MTPLGIRAILMLVLLAWAPLQARGEVLMKAMRDEMQRSFEELRLGDMERPYFIAYSVRESASVRVAASLGAVASRRENSSRILTVELRVGSRNFDNTNFFSRSSFRSTIAGSVTLLPFEDDYSEIRRKIWLATDSAYKQALDSLSKKRAALQNQTRVNEIADFSVEDPFQYTDDRSDHQLDPADVESLARNLSAVFDGMAHLFFSEVQIESRNERVSYVNSEGSSFIRLDPSVSIRVLAGTQADDGTPLEDSISVHGRSWDDLPPMDDLAGQSRDLADSLQALRAAGSMDRYTGPVLFEGQAAAELVRRVLAPRLLASKPPIADDPRYDRTVRRASNPFVDKLGSRVLPRFLSVVDNPTLDSHEQIPLLGGNAVDDEGVPARETALVQRGLLKTLLATRNPVEGIPSSTGSRRYGGPAPSNLLVIPHAGLGPDAIREEMLGLVRERELDFGISVRRIGNPQGRLSRERRPAERSQIGAVVAYKVYPDGREELIRQAALVGVDESDFRDIVAASSARTVFTTTFLGGSPSSGLPSFTRPSVVSLVVPSLLFEDITIRRSRESIPRPPVVPHPLSGG